MTADSEVDILSRIIEPDNSELPAGIAQEILKWKFSAVDRERMGELLERAKSGNPTRKEKVEAEKYERVGHLVSILKSKARRSLKKGGTKS